MSRLGLSMYVVKPVVLIRKTIRSLSCEDLVAACLRQNILIIPPVLHVIPYHCFPVWAVCLPPATLLSFKCGCVPADALLLFAN